MLIVTLRHNLGLSVIKRLPQVISFRSYHKKQSKMDEPKLAYFHSLEGTDFFKVSFWYINETLNVNRQFNFMRRPIESIETFLSRVSANLEKVVGKKLKKRKIAESGDDKTEVKVVVELVSNRPGDEQIPKDATCRDIFFSDKYPPGSLALRMMGDDYTVAIDYPWIDSMTLPSSLMVGFLVYPSCFEAKFTNKSLSAFVWMKSLKSNLEKTESNCKLKQDDQWSVVGEGFIYVPTVADMGHRLKLECTPRNSSAAGPRAQHESSSVVEAGPGHCPFENRHLYTSQKTPKNSFRVVSYNILADVYSSTDKAQDELFSYCPAYALNIDYRKQLFLKELLGYNADLICLQEVDTRVFESDLVPVLGGQNLVGVFAKKSTIREGVACFYSSSKFKMLEVQEVVVGEELVKKDYCSNILAVVNQNAQLKQRITGLGTTAQAVVLESLDSPGEVVVVGNTHLYYHPDADHIRLLQAGIIMAFLTDMVNYATKKYVGQSVSLLCCGDFNSVPSCGIYKLMTTKSVPSDFADWKSKPEEEVKELSLTQPFNIESACGTPKYTNYTVGFADCLDYIFYQTERLAVQAVVPMPTEEELQQHSAIPSVVFPSDHIALVADLQWKVK